MVSAGAVGHLKVSGAVSAAEQEGDVGHHGPGHRADAAHTPGSVLKCLSPVMMGSPDVWSLVGHLVIGGGHQAVEQGPQGAGVASLLWAAPRTAATSPAV